MALLHRFYTAFQQGDHAGMAACYHNEARFNDPVFGDLDAAGVRAMWAMLLSRATDLQVVFNVLEEDANGGAVHWEATYTFGQTGRKVRNRIEARFRFKDGLIIEHRDHFDLWRWSRQALGAPGWILGWSPLVKNKVRRTAARSLARAMQAT